ncbi:MAG: ATP synthase F1 subunit gamma [Candidatus Brocadiae bacterium]|nr:ATP synthase F1 subunit gamma [Candidatus Brocadiia bacterium]
MAIGSIKSIRTKIRSIGNIKKITRAMEMVSAAKLRKVQERLMAVRPYASRITSFLTGLAGRVRNLDFPLFQGRDHVRRIGVVLVMGEKGLCGSFNSNMLRFYGEFQKKHPVPVDLTAIGKKTVDMAKKSGVTPVDSYVNLKTDVSFGEIQSWTNRLIASFLDGTVDEVWVLYTEYMNAVTFRPRAVKFLPVETEKTEGKEDSAGDYEFEPSPKEILDRLIPRYVQTTFHRLLLESMSSEHAARMNAMHNATDNAKDLVSSLTLIYNKARQASITKELLDIVGGAEALRG